MAMMCAGGIHGSARWGVERMMHGVEALRGALEPADEATLRDMLVSESNWLLDEYPVTAALRKSRY